MSAQLRAWVAAELPIWAIASGLPSPRMENWGLLALQAFIDDSREGDVFVLAGYVSTVEKWAAFSRDWQRILDRPPSLGRFKMNDVDLSSPSDTERTTWFYRAVEEHALAAVSCYVPIDQLRRAVKSFAWPENFRNLRKLENPYFFAFRAVINVLAQHQEQMGLAEPIDFVFDNQTEKSQLLDIWDRYRLAVTPEVRRLTGNQPIFRNEEDFLPLQAADLWAWWVRRWIVNGIDDGIENLRFAWEAKRDIPRLSVSFVEQDFLAEFAKAKDPKYLKIASMTDAEISAALSADRDG